MNLLSKIYMKSILMQFDDEDLNLEILAEEAAEVIQIKSKIIRFGMNNHHKKQIPDKNHLEMEIGHFIAMVEILIENNNLSRENIIAGMYAKFEKLPKYYSVSKSLNNKKNGGGDNLKTHDIKETQLDLFKE